MTQATIQDRSIKKALIILFLSYAGLVSILIEFHLLNSLTLIFFLFVSVIVLGVAVIYIRNTRWWIYPKSPFPREWRTMLLQDVSFYKAIGEPEKRKFEKKILFFLANYKITGVDTEVETADRLFIAASSIIPTFQMSRWKYTNLNEVLLYPTGFTFNLPHVKEKMVMEGLVGGGPLEGKMILSKAALRKGFHDESDNLNTAIHEFVHLIDKDDGTVDGVPESLLRFPLLHKLRSIILMFKVEKLFEKTAQSIKDKQTDIRPYGGVNKAEFLSVATEYFFENPEKMRKNDPKLHRLMEQIYRTPRSVQKELSRNI